MEKEKGRIDVQLQAQQDEDKFLVNTVFTNKNIQFKLTHQSDSTAYLKEKFMKKSVAGKGLYCFCKNLTENKPIKLPAFKKTENTYETSRIKEGLLLKKPKLNQILTKELMNSISQRELRSRSANSRSFATHLPPVAPTKTIIFQSPINKIRYELINAVGIKEISLKAFPSRERIDTILKALTNIGEERVIFDEHLLKAVEELRRGLYLSIGEFSKFYPLLLPVQNQLQSLSILNSEELPFFEVLKYVIKNVNEYVVAVLSQYQSLNKILEEKVVTIFDQNAQINKLQTEIDRLKKLNENPLFLQYNMILEENSKLNNEINLLKYRIITLQEELDIAQKSVVEETDAKMKMGEKLKKIYISHEKLKEEKSKLETFLETLQKDYVNKIEEAKGLVMQIQKHQEHFESTEHELHSLAEENRLLSIRAAASFDELTPRHKSLYEECQKLGFAQINLTLKPTSIEQIEYLLQECRILRDRIREQTIAENKLSERKKSIRKVSEMTSNQES